MANPITFTRNTGTDSHPLNLWAQGFDAGAALANDTTEVILSSTLPTATDTLATTTGNEISGNGYVRPAFTLGTPANNGVTGRVEVAATNQPTFTATGGNVVFQYASLVVSNLIVGFWSWAAPETIEDGNPAEFNSLIAALRETPQLAVTYDVSDGGGGTTSTGNNGFLKSGVLYASQEDWVTESNALTIGTANGNATNVTLA